MIEIEEVIEIEVLDDLMIEALPITRGGDGPASW